MRARIFLTIYGTALGAVFGSLAVPLAFEPQGVAMVWAVEGAGIYWLSLVQRRRLARLFSIVLMLGATLSYLQDVSFAGVETLLTGSPLGAALLGVSFLFCHRALRRAPADALNRLDRVCPPVFAVAWLAFLYLVAPLCFERDVTVIAWALAGAATVFAGLRLASRAFLVCAFGIQLLGGLLFSFGLEAGNANILGSGGMGGCARLGARLACWRVLAFFCFLPLIPAALELLRRELVSPSLTALVWTVFFAAHLLVLRQLADLLPAKTRSAAHVFGVWLLVGVLMLASHDAMMWFTSAEPDSAWRWLTWALAPNFYLWLAGSERGRFWPLAAGRFPARIMSRADSSDNAVVAGASCSRGALEKRSSCFASKTLRHCCMRRVAASSPLTCIVRAVYGFAWKAPP
ncbi:MAG: DUF2339 domain-containing protein [Azoarcus sp.]|jgi:uncharacterized membrane protein|nr:DUF2339 domain-containing protein [Azoarcus sp.]